MSAKIPEESATKFNQLMSQMTPESCKILQRLTTSKVVFEVYMFYIKHPESYAGRDIAFMIQIPEPSAYYAVKRLRKMGLIKVTKRARVKGVKGGPRPVYYTAI